MKRLFKTHKLAIAFVVAIILVACGGKATYNAVNTPNEEVTVYKPGDKNEGGITYTKGTGSLVDRTSKEDKDSNGNGVSDRVEAGAYNMYPGTTTNDGIKRDLVIEETKLYEELLSIPNDKLPKTKEEAAKVVNSEGYQKLVCKEVKLLKEGVLSYSETEEDDNRIFLLTFYNKERIARHAEIQLLAMGGGTLPDCSK